jgi:hypothetical protein
VPEARVEVYLEVGLEGEEESQDAEVQVAVGLFESVLRVVQHYRPVLAVEKDGADQRVDVC